MMLMTLTERLRRASLPNGMINERGERPSADLGFSGQAFRVLVLAAGAAALAIGLWSGLARIGIMLPGGLPRIADRHGALMVCGFFGTLISLERAVAVGRGWAYAAPVFSALGVLLLVFGAGSVSITAFMAAGLALTVTSAALVVRQPALFTIGLTVAAASWMVGSSLWLAGRPIAEAVGWWLAFLVVTIAAERLELSRVLQPSRVAQGTFAAALCLVIAGAAVGELAHSFAPIGALGFIGCAGWLFEKDVARRTVRQSGQTRFSAICMLAGYAWLAVAGLELLLQPPGANPFTYDAVIHAVAIGFVLSMVFGHALIILPAVLGLHLRYTPALYPALVLLHLSVATRILGDLSERSELRAASGVLTVTALVGFAAALLIASISNRRTRSSEPP
jgi:hypothetical protein